MNVKNIKKILLHGVLLCVSAGLVSARVAPWQRRVVHVRTFSLEELQAQAHALLLTFATPLKSLSRLKRRLEQKIDSLVDMDQVRLLHRLLAEINGRILYLRVKDAGRGG